MQKTSQFKTQCKGDISHAFETAKITVFYPMVCKTPDVPLQNELLCSTFVVRGDNWPTDINQPSQLRASQSSVITWMGILIQSLTHITCDLKVEVVHACPTSIMLLT